MIYLSNQDLARLLTPHHCIEVLSEAFDLLAEGKAISRPRSDVWVPCSRSGGYYRWGSMDGAIEPWGIFATRMKSDIVTWNAQGGSQLYCVEPGTFSGFLMAFSTRNGEPLAIMNDGILHHLRVAAAAALGAKLLAKDDASIVGILGSGGMARSYLECFCEVRKVSLAKVFSPTKANRESFAEEMSQQLGIPVQSYDSPEPVVRGSDIVSTCTNATKPVVSDPSWIEKGMHLTNLSASEWSWDVVQACDVVVQVGAENAQSGSEEKASGRNKLWSTWMIGRPEEIAQIPRRAVNNVDFQRFPSLANILNDPTKRRTDAGQITFFHNLGLLGFQFAAVAAKAYELAKQQGLGLKMSTEPFLQDIRD
jgi:alanine dehydrogenase